MVWRQRDYGKPAAPDLACQTVHQRRPRFSIEEAVVRSLVLSAILSERAVMRGLSRTIRDDCRALWDSGVDQQCTGAHGMADGVYHATAGVALMHKLAMTW